MMTTIALVLNLLLLLYLGWGALYQLTFAVAGIFYRPLKVIPTPLAANLDDYLRIKVFIPAYREDVVILHTAGEALKQQYPHAQYQVEVIADQLQPETLQKLRALPVGVTEVHFEKSTKSKALNVALHASTNDAHAINFEQGAAVGVGSAGSPPPFFEPDIAVILDADNVMAPDFLQRVNHHFQQGVRVLQGQRAAKNQQTGMALLDAASESANNHILCRGHRVLGLSARLAGSGMAFEYAFFKKAMSGIDVVGGFDKALELYCTENRVKIAYDELAIVYDEKVSASASFARQRSRWIAAQFDFAKQNLPKSIPALLRGNIDFFNKSIQMALPPRLLLPGLLFIGMILNAIAGSVWMWGWALAFAANVLSYAIALPGFVFAYKNLHLWLQIPVAFWATIRAMMRMKEARKKFIVTPKTVIHTNPEQPV